MTQMSPGEAKADALARFTDPGPGHVNCAQAVARYALLVRGYDPELVKSAQFFGGGVAGMGETCGAITGAALALGLCEHERMGRGADTQPAPDPDKPPLSERLQALVRGFAQEFEAIRCRDLTGHDLSTPEGRKVFHESEDRHRCAEFVGWACDRLTPLLLDP
jgi:C_GCAxxG_C_C family probable redox protein